MKIDDESMRDRKGVNGRASRRRFMQTGAVSVIRSVGKEPASIKEIRQALAHA